MSILNTDFLNHILEEIDYLENSTKKVEFNSFIHDETLKRAVTRSIEIIGEAVKNLPKDLFTKYPEVNFKNAARMRDRLIHGYFDVDYSIVWQVIKQDIPVLKKQIKLILDDLKQGK